MRRAAILALALAALFIARSASAQTPRQDYLYTDGNGVGVVDRQFHGRIADISIGVGSAELGVTRPLGLQGRGTFEDMFPGNQYAGYYTSTSWGSDKAVHLFDRRIDFDAQGNSEHGRIADIANGVAFYAKDGTVYRFEEFTSSTGPITKPMSAC